MFEKNKIRKEIKKRLSELTDEQKRVANVAIAASFLSSREFLKAQSLFIYYSTSDEADTHRVIDAALAAGKKVFLPRVEGVDMKLIPFGGESVMQKGVYGVLEPVGEPTMEDPDLAVIPLVGFDKNRRRLGRGKGYYDRFLASYTGRTVALAFSVQEAETIPTESFDVSPEVIITEKERLQ